MLFVGQLLAHLRQILQKSSTPMSIGLVGEQRHVGQDRIGHVDAGAEPLGDHHAVAAELAQAGGETSALRVHRPANRRVAQSP